MGIDLPFFFFGCCVSYIGLLERGWKTIRHFTFFPLIRLFVIIFLGLMMSRDQAKPNVAEHAHTRIVRKWKDHTLPIVCLWCGTRTRLLDLSLLYPPPPFFLNSCLTLKCVGGYLPSQEEDLPQVLLDFFFFFSCMCQGKPWPISWINSCITTRRYGGYAALSSHQGTLPLHVLLHELSIFFYFPQHVCCFFGFPCFSSRLRFSFSYLCCLFVCT